MLIDNKTDIYGQGQVQTVWNYLHDHVQQGNLDIVSGFFSIAGLHALYTELNPDVKYRLILSEMTRDDDFMNKVLDLLQGDSSITNALQLSDYAKNAVAFLRRQTVEVRSVSNAFCHAKAYVYRDKAKPSEDSFFVTGSSNLTEAGLGIKATSNIELNHAERGNSNAGELRDIRDWFKNQWDLVSRATIEIPGPDGKKTKKDVKEFFIEQIEQIFRVYTPEEIYYKVLYELFNSDLDIDNSIEHQRDMTLLQDSVIWRTLFDFQQKGVISLIKMLRKYNGAILADAVGLGKTFSALAVIKYFQSQNYTTVVLCPKKLEQNWQQYRRGSKSLFESDEFDYQVRFHTDLQSDRLQESYTRYKLDYLQSRKKLLVVIDESHNLRNEKTARYKELLEKLIQSQPGQRGRDVKVLMLSATPINTGLNDIKGQFKLIAHGDDQKFDTPDFSVHSLTATFSDAQSKYKNWCLDPNRTIGGFIKMLPQRFFNLTDKLIVARTRKLIEKTLGEDLGFPTRLQPLNIYQGVDHFGTFTTTDQITDAFESLNLTAYQPSLFLHKTWQDARKEARADWDDDVNREMFLVKMMGVLFMKRLESSWYSCMLTVEKVLSVHESTLEKVVNYRDHGIDAEIRHGAVVEDEDYDELLVGRRQILVSDIKNLGGFEAGLRKDINTLEAISKGLKDFEQKYHAGKEHDLKLDELERILREKLKKPNKKVVIFTAYTDTAHYLFNELSARGFTRMASVSGSDISSTGKHSKKEGFNGILQSFAPYSKLYKELDWTDLYDNETKGNLDPAAYYNSDDGKRRWEVGYEMWQDLLHRYEPRWAAIMDDGIDILIATDCLSEGQNLQDADLQINYDIHWNPVRLIQRFGRIDRIGSPNKTISCVNFWPAKSFEDYLKLEERIQNRMSLMTLVDSEVQELGPKFKQMVADNPIQDRNADRLLEELTKNSLSDIESAQSLSLSDLSLEVFRQDFLDYLEKHQDFYRRMPYGAFSGFRAIDNLFEHIPESLVAVVGYPHRESGDTRPYQEIYLMCQPVDSTQGTTFTELNDAEVLDFLRKNRNQPTYLPDWILKPDYEKVSRLTDIIRQWLGAREPKEMQKAFKNLIKHKPNKVGEQPSGRQVKEKYNIEQFDLITWEYITRN